MAKEAGLFSRTVKFLSCKTLCEHSISPSFVFLLSIS